MVLRPDGEVPSSGEPALFRAYPHLRGRLPWSPLGSFPTPVERVEGLLPPSVELWVKREDRSGTLYGGNKVRKLEFLIAQARASGARRLVTVGGVGSHHVLATALYGRASGLAVEAVVFPQPVTDHVRTQILCDLAAGAELHPTRGLLDLPLAILRARAGGGACWIGGGGSSPRGTLGAVSLGVELAAQIEDGTLPRPDLVYVALGSCGTVAGLLRGLSGPRVDEIVAVRVVDRAVAGEGPTRRLAAALLPLLYPGLRPRLSPPPRLRVDHRFFGGAYGRETPEAQAAVAEAAGVGLHLEPTYTGKAMAALLHDARAGRLDGKRVLFLHSYNGVDLRPLLDQAPPLETLAPRLRRHFPPDWRPPEGPIR